MRCGWAIGTRTNRLEGGDNDDLGIVRVLITRVVHEHQRCHWHSGDTSYLQD